MAKPRRKPRKPSDDLTIDNVAPLKFRAWPDPKPTDARVPTNEEWCALANPHLVTLRVAWMLMHKSKADIVKIVGKMDADAKPYADDDAPDPIKELFRMLDQSKDWFEGWQLFIDSATNRLTVACAAHIKQSERKKAGK